MIFRIFDQYWFGRGLMPAVFITLATISGFSGALAGECPASQMKADVRPPVSHPGKGVTDTVLAAIDLEKEPANIKERQLPSAS